MNKATEWQPARFHRAHRHGSGEHVLRVGDAVLRKVVRIRPIEIEPYDSILALKMEVGCDADRFFEVNPEDIPDWNGIGPVVICEHQVSTD